MKADKKTIAVFVDQIIYYDTDGYSTDESFVEFVKSFLKYFNKIVFIGRVLPGSKPYRLNNTTFEVHPLPYYENLYTLGKKLKIVFTETKVLFNNYCINIDLYWLCGPHPISIYLAHLCRKSKKPYFLMVRQNLMEQVRHRNKGFKKLFAMSTVYLLETMFRKISTTALTFPVGNEVYTQYKTWGNDVHEVIISLIKREKMVVNTANIIRSENNNILSVGRLEPEKGIKILIKAFSQIHKKRPDSKLKIVGHGYQIDELKRMANNINNSESISFSGYVPFGEKLDNIYSTSDIFVLPSLTGEGFPQVIVEAMSFKIPVIATKVGGIPTKLKDGYNALLVEPNDSNALCEAVMKLSDEKLKEKLITNALQTIKTLTIEAQRDIMYQNIITRYPHLICN